MKGACITELLDLNETMARELFEGKKYPWEVLPLIHDFILKTGPALPEEEFEKRGEDIWVARDAVIWPTVSLTGPCIVDKGAQLRQCAFIRGNAIIGAGAVVGNSTELKNVILFNKVEAPHYNYVGDSILGFHAHMGAGSITSNIKSDRKNIVIKGIDEEGRNEQIETGMRKIGAILGDYCEIGCGSVLNPGSIIGRNTIVYPLSSVRGIVPGESIYKTAGKIAVRNME
ncbi:MAG: UDP-N-acetylglucosamine pyrophosphorylase [Eubacterium sp.]|nr:UDP-N-acetylglucosamine pyrophosphorylase [Eubacterium sp.]